MEVQKFVSGEVTYEALIDSFLASEILASGWLSIGWIWFGMQTQRLSQ